MNKDPKKSSQKYPATECKMAVKITKDNQQTYDYLVERHDKIISELTDYYEMLLIDHQPSGPACKRMQINRQMMMKK
jgi:hypothetical protein